MNSSITTPSPYVPSEIWQNHVLSELNPDEILDSVCGVDVQLTRIGTSLITESLNERVALVDLFEEESKLDKHFRNILANPQYINYLDYSKLKERRLYFIPISQRLTHLSCMTPIDDEELEKIAIYAERRQLQHLQELELVFFQFDKMVNLQLLGLIFQVSQITSLTLEYRSTAEYNGFKRSILKILPNHLTKLVLHNAGLIAEELNIFKSKKFLELKYLDLSHHDHLKADSALASILEGQLTNLETLILDDVGYETFPNLSPIKELNTLKLKKISLKQTYLRDPDSFINRLNEIESLDELLFSSVRVKNAHDANLKKLKETHPNLQVLVLYKYR